jgi:nitrogen fixation/metabolism regulation signal transduction histidine kinase
MRIGHASEQTSLEREHADGSTDSGAELPVSLTATALADDSGAVLVIEDLSDLISAQRASAWQEVARRMAHEIKNPLTPIQLSAERIARRFVDKNGDADSIHETDGQTVNVIQSGTETILREVESLKSMVNEFSRYARLPNAKLEPGSLNELIEQVAVLYDGRRSEIKIDLSLDSNIPPVPMDPEQLKRAFVNLIENAIEAFPADTADKRITISSRLDQIRDIIFVEVSDNGKGLAASEFSKIFQPYYSTKGRGTGLGLAIVQQIIVEHGGKIRAAANKPNGAKFTIEIPVNT